jgi:hypothetical protein
MLNTTFCRTFLILDVRDVRKPHLALQGFLSGGHLSAHDGRQTGPLAGETSVDAAGHSFMVVSCGPIIMREVPKRFDTARQAALPFVFH